MNSRIVDRAFSISVLTGGSARLSAASSDGGVGMEMTGSRVSCFSAVSWTGSLLIDLCRAPSVLAL